jgi:hypothetical protein
MERKYMWNRDAAVGFEYAAYQSEYVVRKLTWFVVDLAVRIDETLLREMSSVGGISERIPLVIISTSRYMQ